MANTNHGIVALVRDKKGRFLLIKDKREQVKGMWAPPHGVVEDIDLDEKTGVVREVQEKCGITVTPIERVLTQPADTSVETVYFWTVDYDNDQAIRIDEDKLSDYGWFSLEEALCLKLYPGTKIFFDKVRAGKIAQVAG